ncbi:MAG: dolichyl-phosphate beta-glucosyltransferase [Watsoniomyces obsoletus]|nr:MAG: dolichyl-phosphate beta-glucosyltransferase [Watsoniomyces obsoletus]
MASDSPPLAFLPTPAMTGGENVLPDTHAPSNGFVPSNRSSVSSSSNTYIIPLRLSSRPGNSNNIPVSPIKGGVNNSQEKNSFPGNFAGSYIEQSRSLLADQRRLVDEERTLFEKERALWEAERQALHAHIRELERSLGGAGGRPGYMKAISAEHVQQQQQQQQRNNNVNTEMMVGGIRQNSLPETSATKGERVWESPSGSIRRKPSRVFNDPPNVLVSPVLSSIPESWIQGGNSTRASHTSNGGGSTNNNNNIINSGIDISLIRKDLDGITLKTSAVPASVISRVISSSSSDPFSGTSSVDTKEEDEEEAESTNRTLNAGHTPPPPTAKVLEPLSGKKINEHGVEQTDKDKDFDGGSSATTPTQNIHAHLHPPSVAISGMESAIDTGVSTSTRSGIRPGDAMAHTDPDPVLKGPLSLPTEGETGPDSSRFLKALDSKLMVEARKVVHRIPSDEDSISTTTTSAGGGDWPWGSASSASAAEMTSPIGNTNNNNNNNLTIPGQDQGNSNGQGQSQGQDSFGPNISNGSGGGNHDNTNTNSRPNGNGNNNINNNNSTETNMNMNANKKTDEEIMPEPEIKLRFKRSMNFGSAFGSKSLGGGAI